MPVIKAKFFLPGKPEESRGRKSTMKLFIALIALVLSSSAIAQGRPPKADAKPAAHAKGHGLTGCKFVGTVRGTRLWAGDCTDAAPAAAAAPSEAAPASPPPGQKQ